MMNRLSDGSVTLEGTDWYKGLYLSSYRSKLSLWSFRGKNEKWKVVKMKNGNYYFNSVKYDGKSLIYRNKGIYL